MTRAYSYNKAWRMKHPATRHRGKGVYYRRLAMNRSNARQLWTEKDLDAVLAGETTDRELADRIGRSVHAIQIIRCKALKAIAAAAIKEAE